MGSTRFGARWLLGATLCLAAATWGQWTPAERQGWGDTMRFASLTETDLGFEKKHHRDSDRLPLVNAMLDRPLGASEELMGHHAFSSTASVASILQRAVLLAGIQPDSGARVLPSVAASEIAAVPVALQAPVRTLIQAVRQANLEVRAALEPLTLAERRTLIEGLPGYLAETQLVKFDFVRQPAPRLEALRTLLAKVDRARILNAGADLATQISTTIPLLRDGAGALKEPLFLNLEGVPTGIYPNTDDVHDRLDLRLEIDLGGNDRYVGRHGAGVGYAAVCIDLGGEDLLVGPDLNYGVGLLGIGIARFGASNVVARTGDVSLGVGIGGLGAFVKEGGDDLYFSGALAQGFGAWGVGLTYDAAGNDRREVSLYGQGCSRSAGVGWLADLKGNDVYLAGGLVMNEPLFSGIGYAFSQGFSSGYREDTGGFSGGIGLLTDQRGNDRYLADTYAQGASYWYGLGSLHDASGHDTYQVHHYGQGSAMHFCAAALFDLDGDDSYTTTVGASHAIGHDYGVAVLLDRAGNDVYAGKDSAPGVGSANGVGLFMDGAGDDRYNGPPARGLGARGTGSIAVFADLGGTDQYAAGLKDGDLAVGGTWGVSLDQPNPSSEVAQPAHDPLKLARPGSKAFPGDAKMDRLYAEATQWRVGSAVKTVDAALLDLVEIGMPALEWMVLERLGTADRLQLRAFVTVIRAIGGPAREFVAGRLLSASDAEASKILSLAIEGRFTEVTPLLAGFIEKPALQRQAIRAAGELGAKETVPALLPLCLSADSLVASMATVALGQIGAEESYTSAEALLTSSNFPQRMAAIQLVAKFPARALVTAGSLLEDRRDDSQCLALMILQAVGTRDAAALAATRLTDLSPRVRVHALYASAGRCPAEMRSFFLGLRQDPDPFVRAVATKLEP